jgi:hypothetical protein
MVKIGLAGAEKKQFRSIKTIFINESSEAKDEGRY